MIVLDSSAWLSYFADERNAGEFSKALCDFDKLLVPTIILTEVFKNIVRQRDEHTAMLVITQMQRGRVIGLDDSLAIEAALCGLEFKLPLADSIIYATARQYSANVWTQDSDFEGLPGVKYFPC
jgi:predicted nucleic acid-binding protein